MFDLDGVEELELVLSDSFALLSDELSYVSSIIRKHRKDCIEERAPSNHLVIGCQLILAGSVSYLFIGLQKKARTCTKTISDDAFADWLMRVGVDIAKKNISRSNTFFQHPDTACVERSERRKFTSNCLLITSIIMSAKNIPRSERLQKKVWETKDPGKIG